jgi:hypothetical protein
MNYGRSPEVIGIYDLDWDEYMHYMYLPIFMGADRGKYRHWSNIKLPRNLEFAWPLIERAVQAEFIKGDEFDYVYITARRGYATPGNPLNRPGWHSDGFGTNDVNYVWTDRFPTQFAVQDFWGISDDHIVSAAQFHAQVLPEAIRTYPDRSLLRLTPEVVHAAPEIPCPWWRAWIHQDQFL